MTASVSETSRKLKRQQQQQREEKKREKKKEKRKNQTVTVVSVEIPPDENSAKTWTNPVFLLLLISAFELNEKKKLFTETALKKVF